MVALSIGLGSCWVQVRNRTFNDKITSEQYVQKFLKIPEHLKVESIIAIGYAAEKWEPVPRADLQDAKIHENTYSGRKR
jgi:nitroreductase